MSAANSFRCVFEIGSYNFDKDIEKKKELLALGDRLPGKNEVWLLFHHEDGTLSDDPLEVVEVRNLRTFCSVINEDTIASVRKRFDSDPKVDYVEMIVSDIAV